MNDISRDELVLLYTDKKLSVAQIAKTRRCSESKVNYWLTQYRISKRSISDAVYAKHNPHGDPFLFRKPTSMDEMFLYGLGVGLYWGEGTKKNKTSVRLGNSNPDLIKKFVQFLMATYQADRKKIRFGLQIFGDMSQRKAVRFWTQKLSINRSQIMKTIVVTPHRSIGNYREKSKYGVMTAYFNNRKLRDILCTTIDNIAMDKPM